jgi:hypothetical protein
VHPVQDVASLRDLPALERSRNGLFSGNLNGPCVNVLDHRNEAIPVASDPSHSKFDPALIVAGENLAQFS